MKPVIGSHNKKDVVINVPRLLETRLLIQANSGGGKSWALRRLLEQTYKKVQQIIIDPEGEFSTLREKYDYIIAAPHDGDAIARPDTAKLLSRKLLETGVSGILDIYDLKMHQRHDFVKLFLDGLVNAPRKLWRPVIVILDEAHIFAPEKGKAESTGAVIDIATRGRKRGQCLIPATQRLSKLHKDVAAECINKMIGRTGLDIDVKRAADELGMVPKEAMKELRNLNAGEFFIFGPAFSKIVTKIKVGNVITTHPKAGSRFLSKPPAPSAKLKKVLSKMDDLPKEAEAEVNTLVGLKKEVTRLKRELTVAGKSNTIPEDILQQKINEAVKKVVKNLSQIYKNKMEASFKLVNIAIKGATDIIDKRAKEVRNFTFDNELSGLPSKIAVPPRPIVAKVKTTPIHTTTNKVSDISGVKIGRCPTAILSVLSQFPEGCSLNKLTLLTGYRNSGSFKNSLGELRSLNLIEGSNKVNITITEEGLGYGPFESLPQPGEELYNYWTNHSSLGKCARTILATLAYSVDGMGIENLVEETGYRNSGSFKNSLGELRTAGLINGKNNEIMTINQDLIP